MRIYCKGTTPNLFKRECVKQLVSYLKIQELPASAASRAFVRMGMLNIKYNYKNKYNPNLKCRVCNEQDESNKHFQIIEKIIKIRDELINKQTKTTSILIGHLCCLLFDLTDLKNIFYYNNIFLV